MCVVARGLVVEVLIGVVCLANGGFAVDMSIAWVFFGVRRKNNNNGRSVAAPREHNARERLRHEAKQCFSFLPVFFYKASAAAGRQ